MTALYYVCTCVNVFDLVFFFIFRKYILNLHAHEMFALQYGSKGFGSVRTRVWVVLFEFDRRLSGDVIVTVPTVCVCKIQSNSHAFVRVKPNGCIGRIQIAIAHARQYCTFTGLRLFLR